MENVASAWLLFGIALIALNIFSQRFSSATYRRLGRGFQNIFGDRYVSIFLLLDNVCYESALCPRFRISKLLRHRWGPSHPVTNTIGIQRSLTHVHSPRSSTYCDNSGS